MVLRSKFAAAAVAALTLVPFQYAQNATIDSFAGLAGCWEQSDKSGTVISEMWMKPAGNSMMGTGRTVKNGKTVDFEFVRIEQQADGMYYIAKPKANATETPFKLKSSNGGRFVFENLEHDFPQRVIYKFTGTLLQARVEGTINGKTKGIDFPSTRTTCEQK